MNEVQSMAKAGEAVGAVLGTALMSARQGATTASKTGAVASRRLARRTQRRLADSGEHLQDTLVENVRRARHELATKIEPPRRHRLGFIGRRRRWTWLLLAAALVGAAVAAVASRRPQVELRPEEETEADRSEYPSGNGAAPRELQSSQAGTTTTSQTPRSSGSSNANASQ